MVTVAAVVMAVAAVAVAVVVTEAAGTRAEVMWAQPVAALWEEAPEGAGSAVAAGVVTAEGVMAVAMGMDPQDEAMREEAFGHLRQR